MSLLLAHGHQGANEYPLGKVWCEASIVEDRMNSLEATRAILLQMAVSSLFSKEAGESFRQTISELSDGK